MTKPVLVYDHNGSNNGTEIFLFYIFFFFEVLCNSNISKSRSKSEFHVYLT